MSTLKTVVNYYLGFGYYKFKHSFDEKRYLSSIFNLFLVRSELDELTAAEDEFKAGLKLVGLEKGLHLLEDHPAKKDEVVIVIHGVATLGYECVSA